MSELYLPPVRLNAKNPLNGQYLKGHVPFNKGMKPREYMDGRKYKKWRRVTVENLMKVRYDATGVDSPCRKPVISVDDEGNWKWFSWVGEAVKMCGGNMRNLRRCCEFNMAKKGDKRNGKINTDHKYNGFRFYYETDDVWETKIKR